jgi:hypothetical protein
MSKTMANFTKGIVTGVVVGTTVGMVMHGLSKPASPFAGLRISKNASRIVKNVGNVISHAADFIK